MEAIFNMFKVKFAKLDDLLSKECTTINKNSKVNVFINLESVIRKLANVNVEEYLRVKTEDKSFEMISCIINLAAHYRLFFSKNKLYSKVYLYIPFPFSKNAYKNRLINSEYRQYYQNMFSKNPNHFILSSVLETAIPFTKIILEYIDGVYLVQGDYIEPSVIPNVITNEPEDNTVNFIVSTDRYDYQYVNKDYYVIRPKQDQSYVVSKANVIETIKEEDRVLNDVTVESGYYPFILSLLGDKYRNIEKIKRVGLANIIKMIDKAKRENVIGENVFNINILSNIIKKDYQPLLLNNFYCSDVDTQFKLLNIKDLHVITDQITDKFDNVALKKLNDLYFTNYPLYLMELTSGDKFLKKKEKKNIFL